MGLGSRGVRIGKRRVGAAAIAALGLAFTTSARAATQDGVVDPSARATYGEMQLSAGFANDPYRVSLTSGGSIDAASIATGCTGTVARAPDFQLRYDAGSMPLSFGVTSTSDTTLVINGPDGRWTCDDDSGGNMDPLITYSSPQSGIYDVWVGAFTASSQAELFVTELRGAGSGTAGGSGYPDSAATAAYGEIELRSGFTGDPYRVSVLAGGGIDAEDVADHCSGMIASAPDFQVTYQAGSLPLTIGATSAGDVTLVVNGPDGEWYCDDDSGSGNDAELTFKRPQSGVYDIWVGSYDGDSVPAELSLTELR